MIRKLGAIEVAPEEARRIMLDIEAWPEWMPNVRSTRVLERSQQRVVAEVHRAEYRRVSKTKLEFLVNPTGYVERQLEGLARKWEGDWQFRAAPSGKGSIVVCKQDIDLGLFRLFVSHRAIQRAVDGTFERILRGIETRSHRGVTRAPGAEARSPLADVERIQVFSTATGLEIWLDDRRYVARRVD